MQYDTGIMKQNKKTSISKYITNNNKDIALLLLISGVADGRENILNVGIDYNFLPMFLSICSQRIIKMS
jgi:hypothetical protein